MKHVTSLILVPLVACCCAGCSIDGEREPADNNADFAKIETFWSDYMHTRVIPAVNEAIAFNLWLSASGTGERYKVEDTYFADYKIRTADSLYYTLIRDGEQAKTFTTQGTTLFSGTEWRMSDLRPDSGIGYLTLHYPQDKCQYAFDTNEEGYSRCVTRNPGDSVSNFTLLLLEYPKRSSLRDSLFRFTSNGRILVSDCGSPYATVRLDFDVTDPVTTCYDSINGYGFIDGKVQLTATKLDGSGTSRIEVEYISHSVSSRVLRITSERGTETRYE